MWTVFNRLVILYSFVFIKLLWKYFFELLFVFKLNYKHKIERNSFFSFLTITQTYELYVMSSSKTYFETLKQKKYFIHIYFPFFCNLFSKDSLWSTFMYQQYLTTNLLKNGRWKNWNVCYTRNSILCVDTLIK